MGEGGGGVLGGTAGNLGKFGEVRLFYVSESVSRLQNPRPHPNVMHICFPGPSGHLSPILNVFENSALELSH